MSAKSIGYESYVPEPNITRFLFANKTLAPLWLLLRLYIGYEWLVAGWEKLTDPAGVWVGDKAGVAIQGFVKGALAKTTGEHPDIQGWYADFLQAWVLPHASIFAHMVTWGEILVGIGLILGAFTGFAAFFGAFMNTNFLLAGAVSTNPILFIPAILLMLAWRTAGYWGLDRYILPLIGVPGAAGRIFHGRPTLTPVPQRS
ncbi:MAG: DoxX family protein [Chloroflexota bacterium]|nr:DoxX family protein [Chloroflexota bacterium]